MNTNNNWWMYNRRLSLVHFTQLRHLKASMENREILEFCPKPQKLLTVNSALTQINHFWNTQTKKQNCITC